MLVTPQYVADSTGADVSDTARVEFLIGEASSLVMDRVRRRFTTEDAPTAVKQAVAILVAGALGGEDGTTPEEIKSEQIGDYRVEFAGTGKFSPGLDFRRVEHLLIDYTGSARSVRSDVAMDGTPGTGEILVVR